MCACEDDGSRYVWSDELRAAMAVGSVRRPTGFSIDEVIGDVRLLNAVAIGRRALRFKAGSLSLQNAKLQFKLDADSNPVDFSSYEAQDSNRKKISHLIPRTAFLLCGRSPFRIG